jgi:high-affinity iron transporter
MLSTFLISLREGLEAALILSILIAYCVKSGRTSALKFLWSGAAVAGLLALAFGALLSFTSAHLPAGGEERFAGITSIMAVVMVTIMVFWMKRSARSISKQLQGKVDTALSLGNLAVALVAFLAVAREGLETSLFLYATFTTVSQDSAPFAGLMLGLSGASLLGFLMYRRSINFNISNFFRFTGIALIVVAGGVLIHGVSEFQALGDLPGANSYVWNFGGTSNIFTTLTDGTIGLSGSMTVVQLIAYLLYLGITLYWFLKLAPTTLVTAPLPVPSDPSLENEVKSSMISHSKTN